MTADFLTVCLNPVIQKTLIYPEIKTGEVNRTSQYFTDASGKGINVTRVLEQNGASVLHLTHLGTPGEYFLKLSQKDDLRIIWEPSHSEIRFCHTLFDEKNKITTELVEEAKPVDKKTEKLIMTTYSRILPSIDWIIISGTRAAGYSDRIIPEMVKLAKIREKKVVLDIRGEDLLNCLPGKPDVIKPNYQEFLATFLPEISHPEELATRELLKLIKRKMTEIYKDYGCSIILTHADQPLLYLYEGKTHSLPSLQVDPLNTTGCGDAFTAGLTLALQQGASFRDAVSKGNQMGAANASTYRPGSIK